jgi:hypothetical protein
MSTYFKYTSGDSFTHNNLDYYGFFHIDSNGDAYTGKTTTDASKLLTPKQTFISEIFRNKIELNTTFKNIEPLKYYYSTHLNLLNISELDRLTSNINYNNLITFKGLVIDNPYIYNFNRITNHFYALTANSDLLSFPIQNDYSPILNEPFSTNIKWRFLDNIKTGFFVVDDDKNFKYVCSGGAKNYILSGGFLPGSSLGVIFERDLIPRNTDEIDYTYSIYNDQPGNKIAFVNSEYILIYDSSNFLDCGELLLVDKIKIENNTVEKGHLIWNKTRRLWTDKNMSWNKHYYIITSFSIETIRLGKNIRTAINNKNILSLYNKYSSGLLSQIDLNSHNVGEVLSIDIRDIDDLIIILHKQNSEIYVCIINVFDLDNIKNFKIESIQPDSTNYRVSFSTIDSDIIYTTNTHEHQTRHISNPTYPSGRLENGNLLYYDRYIWNTTFEKYTKIPLKWNSTRQLSNYYNNLNTYEVVKNNNRYLLHHNVGRLYMIYQPLSNRYDSNIDIGTPKYFSEPKCSESSIGLYINTTLYNLVYDCLVLYNKSYGKFNISEYGVTKSPIGELEFNSPTFYIHGNETFNNSTLQRIQTNIIETQEKIISTS